MPRRTLLPLVLPAFLTLLAVSGSAQAQQRSLPLKHAGKPTTAAITPADLMTRLYIFADDSMMGRAAGTVHHDRAVNYLAREIARLRLTPAGDSGTYFQHIPIVNRVLAENSTISVDGRVFSAWRDFLPRDNGPSARAMDGAQAVFGGVCCDSTQMIDADLARGKVVLITVPRGWQANRGLLVQRYMGAAAVAVATLDSMPADVQRDLAQPATVMRTGTTSPRPVPSFFYATRALAEAMLGAPLPRVGASPGTSGRAVTGTLAYGEVPAPGSRNVIAMIPGRDPALRGQYVALGAHSDHVGLTAPVNHDSLYAFYHVVRPRGADDGNKPATPEELPLVQAKWDSLRSLRPARMDSIYNGADDDGSGSVALLEVAEALMAAPQRPRRSILFVWHVAEERGLLGAQHFTDYPTVPRDSIVAQINVDMIGRGSAQDTPGGGPGYVQLIGARRLSTQLGDIVEAEGSRFQPPFRFDYQYDANGHPDQYYCRSDHYMYARYGIPVVFMSTGGHAEYHQVTDEPQYIDYDQLARVSQLMLNVTRTIANRDQRLPVDQPKPDPRGACRQ